MDSAPNKWYHRLWFVILMLLAMGPLAFPLLWKSPEFGLKTKWFLTVLFIVLTGLAVWLSVESVKLAINYWNEFQSLLR